MNKLSKYLDEKVSKQFLPSALEIIETPPSPSGRITIWLIFIIILTAILWSIVGRVDEVAIGRGKVIPHGKVKVIQTPENGIILDLHVEEGDQVTTGQKLVELDPTLSEIDYESSKTTYENLKSEIDILEKELKGETSDLEQLINEGVDKSFILTLMELRQQNKQNLSNKEKTIGHEIAQAKSSYDAAVAKKHIAEKRIDMIEEEVKDLKILYDSGAISKTDYVKKCDELVILESELEASKQEIINSSAKIQESQQSYNNLSEEYRRELLSTIVQKQTQLLTAEAQMNKSAKVKNMNTITCPVDGRVNGLGTTAIGGVVQASTPIMTIVPKDTPMIIEANIFNKDIGFVHEGQLADIKVDTFPFQKYGVLEGEIIFISPDAYQDEELGDIYKIKVKPITTTFDIDGKEMAISSGMTTTVEVKVGRRRIIEFFLPAVDYVKESFELR